MHPSRPLALAASALVAPALVVALAGCSGGSGGGASASPAAQEPAASSTPAGPSTSAGSPTPGGPSSGTLATLPAKECLTGTWALVRFVGAGQETYGTGEGGDLTVRFSGGGYTLSGAGRKPVTVTLAGQEADLRVDGRATGTFTLDGSTATFSQTGARGSGTIEAAGRKQRLRMDQVTSVVGLRGQGQVACTADAMTITLSAVRLELGRT